MRTERRAAGVHRVADSVVGVPNVRPRITSTINITRRQMETAIMRDSQVRKHVLGRETHPGSSCVATGPRNPQERRQAHRTAALGTT